MGSRRLMKRKRAQMTFTPSPENKKPISMAVIMEESNTTDQVLIIDPSSSTNQFSSYSSSVDHEDFSFSSDSSNDQEESSAVYLKRSAIDGLHNHKSAADPIPIKSINSDQKMKGIYTNPVIPLMNYCIGGPWANSITEYGEPSCGYCVICEDAKPVNSTLLAHCGHRFCLDCFRLYVAGRINEENKTSVKCPEKKCEVEFGSHLWGGYVPEQVYRRKWLADVEGRCIALQDKITCPYCKLEFVDDQMDFLIRACTNCRTLICTNCMVSWHMGISCSQFQVQRLAEIAASIESPTNY